MIERWSSCDVILDSLPAFAWRAATKSLSKGVAPWAAPRIDEAGVQTAHKWRSTFFFQQTIWTSCSTEVLQSGDIKIIWLRGRKLL
jgi:hypothetical protein